MRYWALVGALLFFPCVAAAQENATPRVSVGAGAGLAFPFHGDVDFTPWAWDADVRVAMAPHVLFEVAVGEWRHSDSVARQNLPVTPGGGLIGRLEEKTTRAQRTLQANVLFTDGLGRVRMNAGGGVGLLQHHRQTTTLTADCSAGVSCGSHESRFSNASGSAQAVGGAEIRLAGGLGLYGQLRFVVPFTDPGGSDLRATAGLRWSFGG
jgi:hypothetical protein